MAYNLDNLVVTSTEAAFEKRLKEKLVIGKLAKTEFKDGAKKGEKIDIYMPGEVTMSKWDGGDLKFPEKPEATVVSIPIDQGRQVNFEMDAVAAARITGASTPDRAAQLVSEYSTDAMEKAAKEVDSYLSGLYGLAGTTETADDNEAIVIDQAHANRGFTLLSNMKAKMSRVDAWEDNKMLAFLSPEMISVMLGMDFNQYTESQVKDRILGELSKKAGWRIIESNNIYQIGKGEDLVEYPLFGIEGRTMAAPIQKKLTLIPYMRDESLNKAYKGGFIFGGGVANSKKLGTAKVKVKLAGYTD